MEIVFFLMEMKFYNREHLWAETMLLTLKENPLSFSPFYQNAYCFSLMFSFA